MPADSRETLTRLWEILKHLPRYPAQVTASEITGRLAKHGLAVEKRTVERDLVKLSNAFPLVCDERSKPFGWAWAKDAAGLSLPGLAASEALSMCLVERYLSELLPGSAIEFLQPHFKEARRKLANPTGGARHRSWLNKVYAIPPTQPRVPPVIDEAVQQAVYDALLEERVIHFRYKHRNAADPKDYRAWPLAIVQRGQVIHLVVRQPETNLTQRFALNRILHVEQSSEGFKYPSDFNLEQWVADGNVGFGEVGSNKNEMVILEFEAKKGEAIMERPLARDQEAVTLPDGRIRISAQLAINRQLVWWILGYGCNVKIIAPQELRDVISATARSVADLYRE